MKHSLNLSPRYVPDWGPWEVSREIICNAIDADPEGMSVETNGTDTLVVETKTVPELSELFVIGEGTKAVGGAEIGQFGEGFKMAALAATRAHGGSLTVETTGKHVSFYFDKSLGVDALHAEVSDSDFDGGCRVTVKMQGVALAFAGRLLPDKSDRQLPKSDKDATRFYCKGVYIGEVKEKGIWDWNLSSMKVNRDRSMVDPSSCEIAVGSFLDANMTPETADGLVERPHSWESYHSLWFVSLKTSHQALADAFYRHYGKKAVIASDTPEHNVQARSIGHKTVECGMGLGRCLRSAGVKNAQDVVPLDHELEPVDAGKYLPQIAWLRSLDPVIGAPGFTVRVFANRADTLKGMAVNEDNLVWLSEGLFTPGNDLELVRTYLHEVGHLMSGARDCTLKFENALDGIAGRLAMALIGSRMEEVA